MNDEELDALEKRLRTIRSGQIQLEAADAIAALRRELAAERERADKWQNYYTDVLFMRDSMKKERDAAIARAERAERECAVAREEQAQALANSLSFREQRDKALALANAALDERDRLVDAAKAEARELRELLTDSRNALFDAIEGFEECSPYKGAYLVDKHGDAQEISKLRAALARIDAALAEKGEE